MLSLKEGKDGVILHVCSPSAVVRPATRMTSTHLTSLLLSILYVRSVGMYVCNHSMPSTNQRGVGVVWLGSAAGIEGLAAACFGVRAKHSLGCIEPERDRSVSL